MTETVRTGAEESAGDTAAEEAAIRTAHPSESNQRADERGH
jgi:hypothetical protein